MIPLRGRPGVTGYAGGKISARCLVSLILSCLAVSTWLRTCAVRTAVCLNVTAACTRVNSSSGRMIRVIIIRSLDLTVSCIRELGVCWNDSSRKIFGYRRQSVKLLQYYCSELPFEYICDLYKWKYLTNTATVPDSHFCIILKVVWYIICLWSMYC